jgi:hypothetical protein
MGSCRARLSSRQSRGRAPWLISNLESVTISDVEKAVNQATWRVWFCSSNGLSNAGTISVWQCPALQVRKYLSLIAFAMANQ